MLSCSNSFGQKWILQDLCCTFSNKILKHLFFFSGKNFTLLFLASIQRLKCYKLAIFTCSLLGGQQYFILLEDFFYFCLPTFLFTVKILNHYQRNKGTGILRMSYIIIVIVFLSMWITLNAIFTLTHIHVISHFLLKQIFIR